MQILGSLLLSATIYQSKDSIKQNLIQTQNYEYISVSECGTNKPYLFILLIGRQWRSIIILITGFERFLFVIYSFWFSSKCVK